MDSLADYLVFDTFEVEVPKRSPRRPGVSPRQALSSTLKAIKEIPLPKCDLDSSLFDDRRFSSDSEDLIFSDCEQPPAVVDDIDFEDLGEIAVCSIDDVVTIVAHYDHKSANRLSRVVV